MALADLATQAANTEPSGVCAVCRTLADLAADEATGLRSLMANRRLRYTEIAAMIAQDEDTPLDLSSDAIGKHARGACAAREKLR